MREWVGGGGGTLVVARWHGCDLPHRLLQSSLVVLPSRRPQSAALAVSSVALTLPVWQRFNWWSSGGGCAVDRMVWIFENGSVNGVSRGDGYGWFVEGGDGDDCSLISLAAYAFIEISKLRMSSLMISEAV
ncbi:hypothetical protein Droror1_Dr00015890 [Drosera rotundifolia]